MNARKTTPKTTPNPMSKTAEQPAAADPNPPQPPAPAPERRDRFKLPAFMLSRIQPTTKPRFTLVQMATLTGIALLAFYLRIRDPLSSHIIGAEDPYLHMARTWDLVQGKGVHDYPLGFMLLLSPLTLLGTDGFYTVTRYLPPLLGVTSVVGMFFLARRYTHVSAALSAALLLAVLPEHIRRTDLLFPTAIDLAVLPFLILGLLRGIEGANWGLPTAGGLTLFLFVIHPWVVALLLPPVAIFFMLYTVKPQTRRWATTMAGGSLGAFLVVLVMMRGWSGFSLIFDQAVPQFGHLLASPSSAPPLPEFVNLPWMITTPIMLLALCGAAIAVWRRTKLHLFALLWSVLLLPLVLVDWLGISFIPHRTVVYLSLGLVLLAALPIAELARIIETARPKAKAAALFGLLGAVMLVTLPTALALEPWDRQYDDDDFAAWKALDERGTDYVVAGSWQSRAGYRSLTANDADYMPSFFENANARGLALDSHPDLVVLIDKHTTEPSAEYPNGLSTDFLSDWTLIGQWGDKEAYTRS